VNEPITWVRDQLNTDERLALTATRNSWKVDSWRNEHGVEFLVMADYDQGPPAIALKSEADAAHIANNDPARVLRQVQAHRAILDEHRPTESAGPCWCCSDKRGDHAENWPCPTVRALISIYSDRDGYRQEWSA
jgi:hypothetical protein